MRSRIIAVSIAAGLSGAGGVILAARGYTNQQATLRPGDPTQPRVWIENTPLRVELTGTPGVTLSPDTTVQVRVARQAWEYRVISIPAGQAPTGQQLAAAGADGWEAFGIPFQTSDGVSLLLKRPVR